MHGYLLPEADSPLELSEAGPLHWNIELLYNLLRFLPILNLYGLYSLWVEPVIEIPLLLLPLFRTQHVPVYVIVAHKAYPRSHIHWLFLAALELVDVSIGLVYRKFLFEGEDPLGCIVSFAKMALIVDGGLCLIKGLKGPDILDLLLFILDCILFPGLNSIRIRLFLFAILGFLEVVFDLKAKIQMFLHL